MHSIARKIAADPTLPRAGWQHSTEFSGPVFLRKYVSGALLTMGYFPSAQSAMLESDEAVWIPNGEHRWRSQDGRSLIEPGSDI